MTGVMHLIDVRGNRCIGKTVQTLLKNESTDEIQNSMHSRERKAINKNIKVIILKADRLHPCDYLHMPTGYRHTDKHLRLVLTIIAFCCTQQSQDPRSNRSNGRALTNRRTHKWMDGWTDGRILPSTLSPSLL